MRVLPILAVTLTVSCSDALSPGHHLTGNWTGANHRLIGTDTGATLVSRCFTVQSPALVLTDSLTFSATGVVTQAGGLITLRVGDPFTITGRVVQSTIVIGDDVLRPGSGGILVCNA